MNMPGICVVLQFTTAATLVIGVTSAHSRSLSSEVETQKSENIQNGLVTGSKKLNGETIQEQYGGLVTNQTITVAGQDFYHYFATFWRDKPLNERFALSIRERPSVRWGNQIFVEYAQRRLFETVLPASRSYIKAISEQAVEISYKNVVDAEAERLLFRDQDLGKDEM